MSGVVVPNRAKLRALLPTVAVLLVLLIVACISPSAPTPTPAAPTAAPAKPALQAPTAAASPTSSQAQIFDAQGPENAVRSAYAAIGPQAGASLPPGLVMALAEEKQIWDPSFAVGDLSSVSLSFRTVFGDRQDAVVRVSGQLRPYGQPAGTLVPVDTVELVHNANGRWDLADASHSVLVTSTAFRQASAEAAAARDAFRLTQADEAIADQDWYIAAAQLRSLLVLRPEDAQARMRLSQIAEKVPGGLVEQEDGQQVKYTGQTKYYAFTEDGGAPLSNLPPGGILTALSADGKRAFFCDGLGATTSTVIELATGSAQKTGAYCDSEFYYIFRQGWSRDADKIIMRDGYLNVFDLATQKKSRLCAVPANRYPTMYWLPDGQTIVYVDGNGITLVDVQSGQCQSLSLPGFDPGKMRVYLPPDKQKLFVIAPGQLLSANRDGTGITKVFDLPQVAWGGSNFLEIKGGTSLSNFLGTKDGTWLYLNGFVLSTRTGRTARFVIREGDTIRALDALAWIDAAPVSVPNLTAALTVVPQKGPRGTRFSFQLSAAPTGRAVGWTVTAPSGKVTGGAGLVDASGVLRDSGKPDGFGMATGLATESGTYSLDVQRYEDGTPLASATFDITD